MRILVYVLSGLIIFLSAVPCCLDEGPCQDAIPEITHTGDTDQNAPHDAENPCSPFYTCGSCTGFVPVIPSDIATMHPVSLSKSGNPAFFAAGHSHPLFNRLLRPPIG